MSPNVAKGSPSVSFDISSSFFKYFIILEEQDILGLLAHIHISSPRCGTSHFSKKLYFLLVENGS